MRYLLLILLLVLNIGYSQCLGDVNQDYTIDVLDVVLVISHILDDNEIDYDIADMNDDENIDILDIIGLLSIILEDRACSQLRLIQGTNVYQDTVGVVLEIENSPNITRLQCSILFDSNHLEYAGHNLLDYYTEPDEGGGYTYYLEFHEGRIDIGLISLYEIFGIESIVEGSGEIIEFDFQILNDSIPSTTANLPILDIYIEGYNYDTNAEFAYNLDSWAVEESLEIDLLISDFQELDLHVYADTEEHVNPDNSITYTTELYALVLNDFGVSLPNIEILFQKLHPYGSLNSSLAQTDSLGNPANVTYTLESPYFSLSDTTIVQEFEISLVSFENIFENFSVSYFFSSNDDPEFNVSSFNFYPNSSVMEYELNSQNEISVIALNDAGIGVQDVMVGFELIGNPYGEIIEQYAYTCCLNGNIDSTSTDTTFQFPGIANITYTNFQGGSDTLNAYIFHPYTSEILFIDSLILNNEPN